MDSSACLIPCFVPDCVSMVVGLLLMVAPTGLESCELVLTYVVIEERCRSCMRWMRGIAENVSELRACMSTE